MAHLLVRPIELPTQGLLTNEAFAAHEASLHAGEGQAQ